MVEDTIKPLLPISMLEGLETRFLQAEKQLTALSKENRQAKWANKVRTVSPSLPLIPPAIDPAVLATVQEALFADEQVEVVYRAIHDDEAMPRRLHPLAFVCRGAVNYLIATPTESAGVRLYALHRIHAATRTYEMVKRPVSFDLDGYIREGGLQFGNGKMIRLSAKISQLLARILEETPLSENQKLSYEGDEVKLTATIADSGQLNWWIMSYGDNIEITAPTALRRKIGGLLAKAAAKYSSTKN